MFLTDWIAIGILALALGAQLMRRSPLPRFLNRILLASGIIILGILIYWTVLQYNAWKSSMLTAFFLPPYQGIGYFYSTVGYNIFSPWLLSALASVVIVRLAWFGNRKFGERFMETEEFGLMRLGIFLNGYPGFLFYILFVLAAAILISAFYSLTSLGRAPLYYLWIPLAIVSILVKNLIIPKEALMPFAF
ncbi:MAG: hypothetical protein AAB655_02785 [Patescibacteria group bacterium]